MDLTKSQRLVTIYGCPVGSLNDDDEVVLFDELSEDDLRRVECVATGLTRTEIGIRAAIRRRRGQQAS